MPISRKSFESGNFKNIRRSGKHPIESFLENKHNSAFTVKELCKALKLKEDSVRHMLHTLKKRRVVVHKSPYFIYGKVTKESKKKSKIKKKKR